MVAAHAKSAHLPLRDHECFAVVRIVSCAAAQTLSRQLIGHLICLFQSPTASWDLSSVKQTNHPVCVTCVWLALSTAKYCKHVDGFWQQMPYDIGHVQCWVWELQCLLSMLVESNV